jgi:ABC-type multidrug transport system permease subunit
MDMFDLVDFADREAAFERLSRHKLDMIIERSGLPLRYWVNEDSPPGRLAEALLLQALAAGDEPRELAERGTVSGRRIDYIDWLFPGILAMNMMFSALFGVGYVIVRYRKNGMLKRLKATPITAMEYLSSQIASRLAVILFSGGIVFAACDLLFGFENEGSYLALAFVYLLGAASIIALGVLIASRSASEEFAGGMLNIVSWPMMFLSEVWFSLEGASPWVRAVSQAFPLTHVTRSMRLIMNEVATMVSLWPHVLMLVLTTAACLAVASMLFKWVR